MSDLALPKMKPPLIVAKAPKRKPINVSTALIILFRQRMTAFCGCGCGSRLSITDTQFDRAIQAFVRERCLKPGLRGRAPTEAQTLDALFYHGAHIRCGCGCGRILARNNLRREHVKARELCSPGEDPDRPENQEYWCCNPCSLEKDKKDFAIIAKGKRIRGETGKGRKKAPIKSRGFQKSDGAKVAIKSRGFPKKPKKERDQKEDVRQDYKIRYMVPR
jgi:hypothetical protein